MILATVVVVMCRCSVLCTDWFIFIDTLNSMSRDKSLDQKGKIDVPTARVLVGGGGGGGGILVVSALDFRSEGRWFDALSLASCCFLRPGEAPSVWASLARLRLHPYLF